jgi:hypothetical protein
MLVLCTWIWHMLRIDGACGSEVARHPGFGGSDRSDVMWVVAEVILTRIKGS